MSMMFDMKMSNYMLNEIFDPLMCTGINIHRICDYILNNKFSLDEKRLYKVITGLKDYRRVLNYGIYKGGNTPLHAACLNSNKDAVLILIGIGVDIDVVNDYGVTPVECAMRNGDLEIVEMLRMGLY